MLSNIFKGNIHLNLNIIVKWTVWRIFYWLWYKPRVVQHVRSRLKGLPPGLSSVKVHLEPQKLGVSGTQKLMFSVRALLNVNHEHICRRTVSTPSHTFYCCDFRTCTARNICGEAASMRFCVGLHSSLFRLYDACKADVLLGPSWSRPCILFRPIITSSPT